MNYWSAARPLPYYTAENVETYLILDENLRIRTGDTDIRMPGRIADLGQSSAASQRVADESMLAVVHCSLASPLRSQDFARRMKPAANYVAVERHASRLLRNLRDNVLPFGIEIDQPSHRVSNAYAQTCLGAYLLS